MLGTAVVLAGALTLAGCGSAYNDDNSTTQLVVVLTKLGDGFAENDKCEPEQSKPGSKVVILDRETQREIGEGKIDGGLATARGEYDHMGMVCEQIVTVQVLDKYLQENTDDYGVVVNGVPLRLVAYGVHGMTGHLFAE